MSKHFTSLGLLALLFLGCSSKNGGVEGANGGADNGGFGFTGGSTNGGAGNSSTLPGGKSIASQNILDQINAASCAGTDSELEVNPALLEFVIDVSGSMNDIPNGATTSKWEITKNALQDAILNQLPDNTGVGMLMFPNMNTIPNTNDKTTPITMLPTSTCVKTSAMVAAGPLGAQGSAQRAAVAAALQNAVAAGGTPTDDAYEYAYNNGLATGLATYSYYSPFMVLITDGQPTLLLGCAGSGSTQYPVDWHPIVDAIQQVYAGIAPTPPAKTFVVGSPGSEAQSSTGADGRPWLSMAARFGGTPRTPDCVDTGPNYCHFDMTQSTNFAQDLSDALKAIIKAAIPCTVKIPPPNGGGIPDPSAINVVYKENVVNGTPTNQWLVGQISDTTCGGGNTDGWYVDPSDPSGTTIVLCPTTCKTVQADKYAVLYVRQGCKTVVPIQ